MLKAKSLSSYYKILDNGCWLWIGGRTGNYGSCRYKGKVTRAHIAVYLDIKGDYPRYLELDHLCRNTLCVNPDHLEPVTHKENMLRGNSLQAENARKTHCPQNHLLDGTNLYLYKDGRRGCRLCIQAQGKRMIKKRKQKNIEINKNYRELQKKLRSNGIYI